MNTYNYKNRRSGKVVLGFLLLVIGCLLLGENIGLFIPGWVFSWPMLLIVIGVWKGVRHNFQNPAAYILIFIGSVFLLERIIPSISFNDFVWPIIIIGIGIYLIFGRNRSKQFKENQQHGWDKQVKDEHAATVDETTGYDTASSKEDYLDTVCVFGGVKKNILSKNFKGGEVITVMGGVELNFSQADLHGTVVLEATQIFGGTKIIVPSHWSVSSEVSAIFGGVEDKRQIIAETVASDKVLIIRGTSIFGGIEIRSF